jgi:hypothetical protein
MAISITILDGEKEEDTWRCWLELTDGIDTWHLPATAPDDLGAGDPQAHFDAQADDLWLLAQEKAYSPNILLWPQERRLIRAYAEVVKDEINIIRAHLGLSERTMAQLRAAIKNKLKELNDD